MSKLDDNNDDKDTILYYTVPENHSLASIQLESASNNKKQELVIELFHEKHPIACQLFQKRLKHGDYDGAKLDVEDSQVPILLFLYNRDKLDDNGKVTVEQLDDKDKDGEEDKLELEYCPHKQPFLVSIFKTTDRLALLITRKETDEDIDIDGHVIGRVLTGRSFVRNYEQSEFFCNRDKRAERTEQKDSSTDHDTQTDLKRANVTITLLDTNKNKRIKLRTFDEFNDPYPEPMIDDPMVDITKFENVYSTAINLKGITNQLYKNKNLTTALTKYRKIDKSLDDYFPDDLPPNDIMKLVQLKNSIYLNIALILNTKGTPQDYQMAINMCNQVLEIPESKAPEQAKALYRRGYARLHLKNEVEAEKDLNAVLMVMPTDQAAMQLMEKVEVAKNARREREKRVYSNAF